MNVLGSYLHLSSNHLPPEESLDITNAEAYNIHLVRDVNTSFSVSNVERAACSFRNANRVQEQAGSMFYS